MSIYRISGPLVLLYFAVFMNNLFDENKLFETDLSGPPSFLRMLSLLLKDPNLYLDFAVIGPFHYTT